ncbi:hypothetical protein N7523_005311 [Penicillium sp. IBT 18751x]|nr:hypothetical protein N7523_005311 [Penicillium sp. IBT 18751x]
MEFSRLPLLPIPASIRRRLPRLYPSHRAGVEAETGGKLRHSSSEPHLPLPDHGSLTEIAIETRPSTASDDLSFDSSGGSSPREDTGIPTKYETESGLRWNRVVPGKAFNLLRNAGYEAQQPRADGRLARSLYINAIMYLLDALPSDLTADETIMIEHRLPQSVKASIAAEPQIHLAGLEGHEEARPGPPTRSYLHRLLASMIVQIFLFVRFILPYAKLFLRNVYEYERSHRLTERFVSTTLDAADGLGKSSVHIGSAPGGSKALRVEYTRELEKV